MPFQLLEVNFQYSCSELQKIFWRLCLEQYLVSNQSPRFWSDPDKDSFEDKDPIFAQMADSLDVLYKEVLSKVQDPKVSLITFILCNHYYRWQASIIFKGL